MFSLPPSLRHRQPQHEEEPRGTKVSERPGWVTVIVNRKGGQLEVPTEEYEEWLDAVRRDDPAKRKKVLNKWGGRRRTMDRRETEPYPLPAPTAGAVPSSTHTHISNSSDDSTPSPPHRPYQLPPLPRSDKRYYRNHYQLVPIDQGPSKRPRYDPVTNDYPLPPINNNYTLPPLHRPPLPPPSPRLHSDSPPPPPSSNSQHWSSIKARYDAAINAVEREGLSLEIAAAKYRKHDIELLRAESALRDAEWQLATMDRQAVATLNASSSSSKHRDHPLSPALSNDSIHSDDRHSHPDRHRVHQPTSSSITLRTSSERTTSPPRASSPPPRSGTPVLVAAAAAIAAEDEKKRQDSIKRETEEQRDQDQDQIMKDGDLPRPSSTSSSHGSDGKPPYQPPPTTLPPAPRTRPSSPHQSVAAMAARREELLEDISRQRQRRDAAKDLVHRYQMDMTYANDEIYKGRQEIERLRDQMNTVVYKEIRASESYSTHPPPPPSSSVHGPPPMSSNGARMY